MFPGEQLTKIYMTLPESAIQRNVEMGQDRLSQGVSAIRVFDSLSALTSDPALYGKLVGAYCSAFGREPWNENNTYDTVAEKMVRQLTIPDTNPMIVTVEKEEQFGFAWGCNGKPEIIIPAAVNNDFPNMSENVRGELSGGVLGEVKKRLPSGEIFWGCELGTDPPGGLFFLKLVREEARRAHSDTLFGLTMEGTSFLELMRARGGYQEVGNALLPDSHYYFLQDLNRFVQRGSHD